LAGQFDLPISVRYASEIGVSLEEMIMKAKNLSPAVVRKNKGEDDHPFYSL
jgi:hypothetical protein